jgi:tetratricopeptide (TPR) repeat protein
MNLGNVLLKQRRLKAAVDAFARAVANDPENADALNNLAWVYLELGENLDKAVHLSRRAALLRPSHRAYYLDTLGNVFLKQGKPQDAISAFEEALAATTDREISLRETIRRHLNAAKQ